MAPAQEAIAPPASTAARAFEGYLTQRRNPIAPDLDYTDHTPSVGDTVKATFMSETTLGRMLDHVQTLSDYRDAKPSSYFNPYRYFLDNADKFKGFPELTYFVQRGDFESVRSPGEFDARVADIERQLDWRRTLQ
jgi:hypothetical protein